MAHIDRLLLTREAYWTAQLRWTYHFLVIKGIGKKTDAVVKHKDCENAGLSLLKDIKVISPHYQTSSLEALHSLDIIFALKHTAIAFFALYTRLY